MVSDLKSLIEKQAKKDFVITPIKNEFVIVFEDDRAIWFSNKPYAIGSIKKIN